MSFALPARQVTFSRSNAIQPQPYQPPQQSQYQPPPPHGIALPLGNAPLSSSGITLPGPSPLSNSYVPPQSQQVQVAVNKLSTQTVPAAAATAAAGPTTVPTPVPSTPVPLTLEQQHITAVEGIVPTLQNIVATVNLDCRLDLKTIALHARNAEYNPKVGIWRFLICLWQCRTARSSHDLAFCGRHYAHPWSEDYRPHLCVWQDGRYRCKVGGWFAFGVA